MCLQGICESVQLRSDDLNCNDWLLFLNCDHAVYRGCQATSPMLPAGSTLTSVSPLRPCPCQLPPRTVAQAGGVDSEVKPSH